MASTLQQRRAIWTAKDPERAMQLVDRSLSLRERVVQRVDEGAAVGAKGKAQDAYVASRRRPEAR